MQIIDNKALVMRLKNPTPVLTTIRQSKALDSNTVAVKWDLKNVHRLRSFNIKAPSPIEGHYKWPGLHKPYDHQKTTASFLTLNPRAFCFNQQGCVDSETEYLSPTGWVKISDYAGGMVAQYDPETQEASFVEPDEYVKLPCAEMIRIKTKYGVDQLLSPEHRVLLEDGSAKHNKRETVSAEELLLRHDEYHAGVRSPRGGTKKGTDTVAFSSAAIPTAFRYIPDSRMPYSDMQLRVLVAVIADGYFGSATNTCTVRLKKPRKKSRLRTLLRLAEISFTERSCRPEGFTKFVFTAPERWKEFGPEFWKASGSQLCVIADEVLHWDGSTTRGERFSSSSAASAEFVQFAFAALRGLGGGTARLSSRERRGSVEHTVQIRRGTDRLYIRGSSPTMWREPSTDGYKYCFRVPTTYLVFRRNGCVFLSGNTGKTGSAIWAADFLMTQKIIKRVLVVCPMSIMDAAWRNDLFTFAMHRKVDVAHGSAEKRRKIIASDAEFVVINYDGIAIVQDELLAGGFDLIIVDEATAYATATTKRWKALSKLITDKTWLWMMTGTPAAQGPLSAYGLAKLVNPRATPRTFTSYRDSVMEKVGPFRWEPKPHAIDIVHQILQPAIRFTKEECLDLPDMVYMRRRVEMTAQQKAYYKQLKKDHLLELQGADVTAVNAAVMMNKLSQLACGCVYTDSGDILEFDITKRYNVLREVIDEAANKVIVFVPFQHTIDVLTNKLRADKISVGIISGKVSAGKRTQLFKEFQTTPDPRVLIVQPQAAAHGVTLTAADTVVWWSPTASLEIYDQANARIHRSGQKNKCTVVQLSGSAVEDRIYHLLDKKIDVHSKIIELYDGSVD